LKKEKKRELWGPIRKQGLEHQQKRINNKSGRRRMEELLEEAKREMRQTGGPLIQWGGRSKFLACEKGKIKEEEERPWPVLRENSGWRDARDFNSNRGLKGE